jgi:hypothetical protein
MEAQDQGPEETHQCEYERTRFKEQRHVQYFAEKKARDKTNLSDTGSEIGTWWMQ